MRGLTVAQIATAGQTRASVPTRFGAKLERLSGTLQRQAMNPDDLYSMLLASD